MAVSTKLGPWRVQRCLGRGWVVIHRPSGIVVQETDARGNSRDRKFRTCDLACAEAERLNVVEAEMDAQNVASGGERLTMGIA